MNKLAVSFLLLFGVTLVLQNCFVKKATAQENLPSFAIVELFTSEGCSSCPPADRLLTEIDRKATELKLPIYVISMHVNYWNRLGWRDPYSTQQFTDRQQKYAALAGDNQVYTPQMIVNGEARFVGSRSKDASKALSEALARPVTATLAIEPEGDRLRFISTGVPQGAVLNVARVQPRVTQFVSRGENSNRTLKHTNVAQWLGTFPLTSSQGSVSLGRKGTMKDATELIAYVQVVNTGKIIAAASISL